MPKVDFPDDGVERVLDSREWVLGKMMPSFDTTVTASIVQLGFPETIISDGQTKPGFIWLPHYVFRLEVFTTRFDLEEMWKVRTKVQTEAMLKNVELLPEMTEKADPATVGMKLEGCRTHEFSLKSSALIGEHFIVPSVHGSELEWNAFFYGVLAFVEEWQKEDSRARAAGDIGFSVVEAVK